MQFDLRTLLFAVGGAAIGTCIVLWTYVHVDSCEFGWAATVAWCFAPALVSARRLGRRPPGL